MSDCLGGYCFYNEDFTDTIEEPRYVDRGKVTEETLANTKAQILEINSKTGLYPLYVTYSIYRKRCKEVKPEDLTIEKQYELWQKTVEDNIFVICKTPMAKAITRRTLLGYRKGKINAHAFDDLIMQIKEKPEQFREKILRGSFWNKENKEMKFDAVVGNPPYQINVGVSKENYSIPVYQDFISNAKKMHPKYLSMIMPARWYAGGRGLENFRNEMLNDRHILQLHDFLVSTDCFPSVDISAGICYFLWDSSTEDDCIIATHKQGKIISKIKRPLLEKGMNSFIRQNELINILNKVQKYNEPTFDNLVSPQTPFGFVSSFKNFTDNSFEGAIKYYTYGHIGYIHKSQIKKAKEMVGSPKVYISAAYGERGEYPYYFLGKPFYGEPNSCCSQSYLVIGPFEDEFICRNVIKYIETKFFRCMIMIKKNAQHNMRYVFECVPILNFSNASDIDWSKSIAEIDQQLYKKYNLSDEEIAFIESMIKPMK